MITKPGATVSYAFFLAAIILMIGGRPLLRAQSASQPIDDLQSEKIARVNDHLASTDRMVEDSRAQLKAIQTEFRDLEAQVNQWKGAEDVWLKIISLFAGGGIVLQLSGKFSRSHHAAAAEKDRTGRG